MADRWEKYRNALISAFLSFVFKTFSSVKIQYFSTDKFDLVFMKDGFVLNEKVRFEKMRIKNKEMNDKY